MNLSYLYTPVNSIADLPIDSKIQELPLEKLAWEDFEKLCLAIIQTEFSVNDCEIYGIKGQAQQGIDIYARQSNGKYYSYQCKRYQKFDLDDINKAIDYFKGKDFYSKSDKLYLCTSCEWNKTQIQDRFEELKTELENENITLVKWDKIQLSRLLKDQPQIVFDFFGLEWVKKFNGELALQQLSKSKKIDAQQVVKFRKELYEFYSTIFNIQDPGIPIKELNSPYTLQDRFIIPDILSSVKEEGFKPTKDDSISNVNYDQYFYDYYGQSENEFKRKNLNNHNDVEESSIDIRIKVDDALVNNNKNIIIGDPGAGKSTLLRYITLDILSSDPQLENISQKYGKTLPVWLPFAFITKHLSQNDSLSISEILNLWFNSFGKNYLFDVVKDAIDDERLFLIIDGIDEWSSISSAQQAITRVEALRELYDCKVLYSSRPYGFKILKDFFTNLYVLNLAGFSISQQRSFVQNWYSKWTSLQDTNRDKDYSKTLTDNFIKELRQSGDLKKLAEIPLLLSILIIQKMQDSVLPKNKLEALKEITQYLIKKHPVKRGTDAGIVQEEIIDVDFKDIFCELAINIQKESNDGVILKSEAQKVVEQYLITYAEYDKAKAKVHSQKLIEVGANNFGIIIEKSNEEIAFGHKQFQEFLAAQQLYESDEDLASEFIKAHSANPTFHQVIISFFGLIPLKQIKKFTKHFYALKEATCEKFQKNYLSLISYEVAINLDNTPSDIMNEAFDSIIRDFEYETDLTYKEALLKQILNALQNGRLKEKIQAFLIQFFPNQYKYRDYRVNALRYTPNLNKLQIEFLKKAFINGTIEQRHDASYAFNKHIKNRDVFKLIKGIISNCSNPEILAFAINSIITNDISEVERENLINSIEVDDSVVQFYLFKYKIFAKKHTQDDLKLIIKTINQIPYQLKDEAVDLLIDGFNTDNFLKEILIKSLEKEHYHNDQEKVFDRGIVWKVLFHCFNKEQDVINIIKSEFKEKFPFISDRHEMFKHLVYYFKDIEELVPVVENWLSEYLKEFSHIGPETAFASIFVHSEKVKNSLFEDLQNSYTSHWSVMALLDGWKDDKQVKEKLKEYFRTVETKKTSASAHFISRVFDRNEKEEAIKILEGILFDKKITFRERSISALIEIDKEYFESNILKRLIDQLETFPKEFWGQYYTAIDIIVKNFHSSEIVQKYFLEHIENDNTLYVLAVHYFPTLIKSEDKMLKKSIPLAKEFKLSIIEAFSDLSIFPNNIETALSNFETEAEEEVMADMAICLFNHIKETNTNKIINLSKPLVFARGIDHEVKRRIAFTGFLITKKLDEYSLIEDVEGKGKYKSKLLDIFSEYTYQESSSGIMIKSILDNFDYLISYSGKDFGSIVGDLKYNKDIEDIWGFFAKYSSKSSPTYSYLMEFISNNSQTIKNNSIISFLNRTSPKSPILKSILLRFINNKERHNEILAGRLLGTNFKNDNQVYEEIKDVKLNGSSGKIIALCSGWPDEPILRDMFNEIIQNQYYVDDYVDFNLKFLFRDIDTLKEFLKRIFGNTSEAKIYHRYFFIPMIERLKRDKNFSLAIKELLLSSNSVSEKISYYNLLAQVNMVDNEVSSWKNKITDFKNDFGYDIVSNKTVRLKDVLHDYYY
ncbi:NACHT domain-containing protein [Chryseobacterium sp. JV558]|uniref:NACHT domain-containing protein n=1 Tax=Chryseobacterium sp. JV558 TaxID=2663236 RepID=UPI00299DBFDA|nr:NACHT domain-containing protein [Chryseobacterium sp. JV558]MDW9381942.1 NACHT domain-containing protein [Chryseobacterium sp. JV558]